MKTTSCQAKDPSTCRYHGAAYRKETALTTKDVNAYLTAAEEEVKKPASSEGVAGFFRNWIETFSPKPEVTEEEIEIFTEGDCWRLAKELNRQFGYPIVLAGSSEDNGASAEERRWVHAFVRTDHGYLDVEGYKTFQELEKEWGWFADGHLFMLWEVSSEDDIQKAFSDAETHFDEVDPADTVAKLRKIHDLA